MSTRLSIINENKDFLQMEVVDELNKRIGKEPDRFWDKVQSKYGHRSSYIESFGIVFIMILDQDENISKTLSAMKVV